MTPAYELREVDAGPIGQDGNFTGKWWEQEVAGQDDAGGQGQFLACDDPAGTLEERTEHHQRLLLDRNPTPRLEELARFMVELESVEPDPRRSPAYADRHGGLPRGTYWSRRCNATVAGRVNSARRHYLARMCAR